LVREILAPLVGWGQPLIRVAIRGLKAHGKRVFAREGLRNSSASSEKEDSAMVATPVLCY
jgi:hypothetical protein